MPSETTTANITPLAAITGNITASNKTYDGGTAVSITSETLTGVLAADVGSVNLTGGSASFASANVANGITVTDSGLSLTGSAASDYSLSNPTGDNHREHHSAVDFGQHHSRQQDL